MNFSLKYLRFGENSILIEWPEAIQKNTNRYHSI